MDYSHFTLEQTLNTLQPGVEDIKSELILPLPSRIVTALVVEAGKGGRGNSEKQKEKTIRCDRSR